MYYVLYAHSNYNGGAAGELGWGRSRTEAYQSPCTKVPIPINRWRNCDSLCIMSAQHVSFALPFSRFWAAAQALCCIIAYGVEKAAKVLAGVLIGRPTGFSRLSLLACRTGLKCFHLVRTNMYNSCLRTWPSPKLRDKTLNFT